MLFPGFLAQAVWGARYSRFRGGAGTVAVSVSTAYEQPVLSD